MKEQALIRISGKVQGVWFRKYTCDKALELALTGWVKNEPDGSVLILACGQPDHLSAFLRWCHQGSPMSRVDHIAVDYQEPENWHSFSIRR